MRRLSVLFCVVFFVTAFSALAQIQPEFFAMGVASTNDMPKVRYGTISHPPVGWTTIEGTGRGVFNFRGMDQFVKRAPKDANGVAQIVIDLGGWTPGWAVADQSSCYHNKMGRLACTVAPDNIQDWVDYVTAVMKHYDGWNAPHVKYYEVWVEGSNTLFWTGTVDQMLALAQAAYPIVKHDKYSQLLTPSVVWRHGLDFMTAYLQAGGYAYADGLAFHGYPSRTGPGLPRPVPLPESPDSTNAPIQTMVTTFRQMADAYGMQGKPIMTTEGGWGTNGLTDPDMQIAWITHYEIIQAGLAASNNLRFQDWFTWGQAFSGTIETKDGNPTSAALAYDVVYGWLIGQQPEPCTDDGVLWSCAVGANVIVWDTSQTCTNGDCSSALYAPSAVYRQYIDTTGMTHPIIGPIALGVKPIMLVP